MNDVAEEVTSIAELEVKARELLECANEVIAKAESLPRDACDWLDTLTDEHDPDFGELEVERDGRAFAAQYYQVAEHIESLFDLHKQGANGERIIECLMQTADDLQYEAHRLATLLS